MVAISGWSDPTVDFKDSRAEAIGVVAELEGIAADASNLTLFGDVDAILWSLV